MLDLDIKIYGGGVKGQAEACMYAVAKAIANYDVTMRPVLKKTRMIAIDHRRVEPKKPGKIKARKGQVYHRR